MATATVSGVTSPANAPAARPRRNSSGLSRDVQILDLLAGPESLAGGGLGVLRIAELTGRDKAVVSRALATLADAGIVARDPTRRTYHLGAHLYALAARTTEATMTRKARPLLRQMVLAVKETAHLCVLREGNVLTLISELSPYEVRTTGWTGTTTAAWRTPSGRVLISDWDRPSVDAWYAEHGRDKALVDPREIGTSGPFPVLDEPRPEKVVVRNLESLHAELARIRQRGYATLDEELEAGVVGASAPIWDATGAIVAAINVSAPKSRMARLDELGTYIARCASALSGELGNQPARRVTTLAPPSA